MIQSSFVELNMSNNKNTIKNHSKKNGLNINKLIVFLFILGVFLKQFYLGSSGSLQIGDIFMISPLIVILVVDKKIKINITDINIFIFFILSSLINFIYYMIYGNDKFIITNIYMIYSMLIIYIFRYLKNYKYFYDFLLRISKIIIIMQLIIFILGLGRYFSYPSRYKGTFNDPNQFGYYILTMTLVIHLTSNYLEKKVNLIYFLIPLYLIYLSGSTGMMLGLLIFTVTKFIIHYKFKNQLFIFVILTILIILIIGNEYDRLVKYGLVNERLLRKLDGVNNLGDIAYKFIIDRNLYQILVNPFGFIYGTGEGYFERYGSILELHSTMIGLFYYYGFIPYLLLLRWIKLNLKDMDKNNIPIAISLIFTAFTIVNHRQPFFWGLLVLI